MSEKCNLYYVGGLLMAVGVVGTLLAAIGWALSHTVALVEPIAVPFFGTVVGYEVFQTAPAWAILAVLVMLIWLSVGIGIAIGAYMAKRYDSVEGEVIYLEGGND